MAGPGDPRVLVEQTVTAHHQAHGDTKGCVLSFSRGTRTEENSFSDRNVPGNATARGHEKESCPVSGLGRTS